MERRLVSVLTRLSAIRSRARSPDAHALVDGVRSTPAKEALAAASRAAGRARGGCRRRPSPPPRRSNGPPARSRALGAAREVPERARQEVPLGACNGGANELVGVGGDLTSAGSSSKRRSRYVTASGCSRRERAPPDREAGLLFGQAADVDPVDSRAVDDLSRAGGVVLSQGGGARPHEDGQGKERDDERLAHAEPTTLARHSARRPAVKDGPVRAPGRPVWLFTAFSAAGGGRGRGGGGVRGVPAVRGP